MARKKAAVKKKPTKKKDPMPFDIQWETDEEEITLHIAGVVSLEKKKK